MAKIETNYVVKDDVFTEKKINTLKTLAKEIVNAINELLDTKQPKEDDNLTTESKLIVGAINEVASSTGKGFFQGEYKWTKTNITLPSPWKKVTIDNGFTLVQGTSEAKSKGLLAEHSHYLLNEKGGAVFTGVSSSWNIQYNPQPLLLDKVVEPEEAKYVTYGIPFTQSRDAFSPFQDTNGIQYDGETKPYTENNLSAGINAQLWVYDPQNKY